MMRACSPVLAQAPHICLEERRDCKGGLGFRVATWVVVKIMVPFWIPIWAYMLIAPYMSLSQLYGWLSNLWPLFGPLGLHAYSTLHESIPAIWVVVKIMVPFGIPSIIWHLIFRVPKRAHNFDNHLLRLGHASYKSAPN